MAGSSVASVDEVVATRFPLSRRTPSTLAGFAGVGVVAVALSAVAISAGSSSAKPADIVDRWVEVKVPAGRFDIAINRLRDATADGRHLWLLTEGTDRLGTRKNRVWHRDATRGWAEQAMPPEWQDQFNRGGVQEYGPIASRGSAVALWRTYASRVGDFALLDSQAGSAVAVRGHASASSVVLLRDSIVSSNGEEVSWSGRDGNDNEERSIFPDEDAELEWRSTLAIDPETRRGVMFGVKDGDQTGRTRAWASEGDFRTTPWREVPRGQLGPSGIVHLGVVRAGNAFRSVGVLGERGTTQFYELSSADGRRWVARRVGLVNSGLDVPPRPDRFYEMRLGARGALWALAQTETGSALWRISGGQARLLTLSFPPATWLSEDSTIVLPDADRDLVLAAANSTVFAAPVVDTAGSLSADLIPTVGFPRPAVPYTFDALIDTHGTLLSFASTTSPRRPGQSLTFWSDGWALTDTRWRKLGWKGEPFVPNVWTRKASGDVAVFAPTFPGDESNRLLVRTIGRDLVPSAPVVVGQGRQLAIREATQAKGRMYALVEDGSGTYVLAESPERSWRRETLSLERSLGFGSCTFRDTPMFSSGRLLAARSAIGEWYLTGTLEQEGLSSTCAAGPDRLVVVGARDGQQGRTWSSTDGVDGKLGKLPGRSSSTVVYRNGKFWVLVQSKNGQWQLAESVDGLRWRQHKGLPADIEPYDLVDWSNANGPAVLALRRSPDEVVLLRRSTG